MSIQGYNIYKNGKLVKTLTGTHTRKELNKLRLKFKVRIRLKFKVRKIIKCPKK
jgi:hypothetical protein